MKPELDCGIAKDVDLFSRRIRAITATGRTTQWLPGLFALRWNGQERDLFTAGRIAGQNRVILCFRYHLMAVGRCKFQRRLLNGRMSRDRNGCHTG
jgi:hypothetical protein